MAENPNEQSQNHPASGSASISQKNKGIKRKATGAKSSSETVSRSESSVTPETSIASSSTSVNAKLDEGTSKQGNGSKMGRKNAKRASSGEKKSSLALVSQKFLRTIYQALCSGQNIFKAAQIADVMGVERRRVYDVINVFEGMKAIEKVQNKQYKWIGLDKLPSLIYEFKACAIKSDTYVKFKKAAEEMLQLISSSNKESPGTDVLNRDQPLNGDAEGEKQEDQEKEKSVAFLCKGLLMILIAAKDHDEAVSLDVAITVLLRNPEIGECDSPSRNQCRRIYDIINIMTVMRLIRKTTSTLGTKKIPCFAYCGPDPEEGGSFNFFEYINEHKLSPTKTNQEEREAFREEEEMLSDLLREKRSKNLENSDPCNDETEQKTKRAKTVATESTNVLVNGNNKNEQAIHVDEGASPLHLPSKRPQSQEIVISGPSSIQQPSHQQRSTRVASPATPNETSVPTIAPNTLPASEQLHGNITRVINDPNNIWMRFPPPIFTQQMGPADFSSHHFLPEFDWQQQNSDLLNYLRGIFAANSAGPSSFQQTSHQQRSTRVAAPATPSETSMQIIAPNTLPTNNQFNGNMPANNVRMRFPRVIFGEQLDPADRSSHRFLAAFDQQQFRGLINHLMEIFAANSANFNGARLS